MRKAKFNLLVLTVSAVLSLLMPLVFIPGCANSAAKAGAYAISATGSDLEQVGAYIHAAEQGRKSAAQHADAVGKALLGQVGKNHDAALAEAEAAKAELAKVQQAWDALNRAITRLQAENYRVTHTIGYVAEQVIIRLAVLFLILAGVHVVAGALAILLPPPWSGYYAIMAHICNPLGWTNWAISAFVRVETAYKKPTGAPDSPIHAVIEAPKPA